MAPPLLYLKRVQRGLLSSFLQLLQATDIIKWRNIIHGLNGSFFFTVRKRNWRNVIQRGEVTCLRSHSLLK